MAVKEGVFIVVVVLNSLCVDLRKAEANFLEAKCASVLMIQSRERHLSRCLLAPIRLDWGESSWALGRSLGGTPSLRDGSGGLGFRRLLACTSQY